MKTTVRQRRSALSGLARRGTAAAGAGAAASAALGILVLATVFIAVALPRANLGYRSQVLRQTFRTASPTKTAVLADADITGLTQSVYSTRQTGLSVSQVGADGNWMAGSLRRAGLPLAPAAAQWAGVTAAAGQLSGAPKPTPGSMAPPQLELLYRTRLDRDARLVAGSLPARVAGKGDAAAFQVAVTATTAARLGLYVGSRLRAAGQALLVTGIIRPVNPGSSFWTVDPNATAPILTYPLPTLPPFLSTAAFVGAAELRALETHVSSQHLTALWVFPLDLGQVSADQAAGLLQALQRVTALSAAVGGAGARAAGAGSALEVNFSAGMVTALPPVLASDAAVQGALSPLFVSLAAIAAVVMLMGAMLVADHRRAEFAVMRARGASLAQVAALAARGAAAPVLPAAAIAVTVGVLVTPGPSSTLATWLAATIIATSLAGPPLLAVSQLRTRRAAALAPAAGRRIRLARRWVTNAALGCAAVGGLIVLRQQGLPPGGLDLLTSLAPVLAAVPIALLIAGCYPLALARLARLARRSRGVVMVVGLARGRAAARATVLPAFALIVAFAVAAFAAMVLDAVARAEVAASWQATPADAVVTAPSAGPRLTSAARRMITMVPGAQQVAMVSVLTGSAGDGRSLPVAVVNPRQYAELAAATPAARFPAGLLARPSSAGADATSEVPALISPAAGAMLGRAATLRIAGRWLRLRVTGRLTSIIGVPPGSRFAVLPAWALGNRAPQPTVIALQGPHLNTGALARIVRRAVPGARITLRSRLLDAITAAPLPHGGFVTLAQGAVAAGAFSLLILLLMMVLSARARALTLARLDAMGLTPAQSRRITVVENLPVILSAALGGTACALALVPLAGPAVDLAAFTGSQVRVPLHADPLALGAVTGGLLLLAGVALTIQDRLARRQGVSQALRAGD
jgi:putative ABC transport system permease protein